MNTYRLTAALIDVLVDAGPDAARAFTETRLADLHTGHDHDLDPTTAHILDLPTCEHLSATGIDQAEGPGKVWRCDGCGWLHRIEPDPDHPGCDRSVTA